MKKNNIRFQGLKEGFERDDLVQYLEELIAGCLRANSDTVIRIVAAYQIGLLKKKETPKYPCVIFVNFAD